MGDKKPVYLLAGGRPRNSRGIDPILRAVFKESGKTSPTIAYSGTANGDDNSFFQRMAEAFREAGAGRVIHAIITPVKANLEKARDILQSADIVFISGGDVGGGMQVLEEKNMVDFLVELYQRGMLFFGSSAGAIMLAEKWVRWPDPNDNSSAELFPCLGIAPVICDCHDEQGGWEELKTALRLEKTIERGYGLVAGAGIRVFPDGKVEALGSPIHQFIRLADEVNRTADIQPMKDI